MYTALFSLKNKKGTAATVLCPGGKVKIEDNVYDAVAENGVIEKGM
jgi:membrane-bound serine protease (ClpP class)